MSKRIVNVSFPNRLSIVNTNMNCKHVFYQEFGSLVPGIGVMSIERSVRFEGYFSHF